MRIPLREVGRVLGVAVESDAMVTGWSVDSRTVDPGDLFFALRGPNHDGNDFVGPAFEKSVVGAVTEHTGQETCATADGTSATPWHRSPDLCSQAARPALLPVPRLSKAATSTLRSGPTDWHKIDP